MRLNALFLFDQHSQRDIALKWKEEQQIFTFQNEPENVWSISLRTD